MKIVIASDSFKGTLSSVEVATIIEAVLLAKYKDLSCIKLPIADGGEGTVKAIMHSVGGTMIKKQITGPLGEPEDSFYLIDPEGKRAYIEIAATSGIILMEEAQLNPLNTTTQGFGELIQDAMDHGVEEIILGLGGSATNDGGSGMAHALGVKFYDDYDHEINYLSGSTLGQICKINTNTMDSRISKTKFMVASDVTNQLLGESGATKIYAKQKGATLEVIELLENNMSHYANVVEKELGKTFREQKGSGAAGGLGFAAQCFLKAEMRSGIEFILDAIDFESYVKDCDVVIVGEGKLDLQSMYGKAPIGIAKISKEHGKKVIGIFGNVDHLEYVSQASDIDQFYSVVPGIASLEEALRNPKETLEKLVNSIEL